MKVNLYIYIGLISILFGGLYNKSFAENLVATSYTSILSVERNSDQNTGDILITVADDVPGRPGGFWVKGDSVGASGVFQIMSDAMENNSPVSLVGDLDSLWAGSITGKCQLRNMN